MLELLAETDKSNCHVHLTGALYPDDLRSIADQTNVSMTEFEPLEEHLVFEDPTIWAAAKEVTSDARGMALALRRVIDRERADKVNYLEVTFNPAGMMRRGLQPETMARIAATSAAYARQQGATLRFKYGINRKDGPASIPDVVAAYHECPPDIRLGVDLNGDERRFPTRDFVASLGAVAAAGVDLYVHAGEFEDCEPSLMDALRTNPVRIAHAIAVAKHPGALSALANSGVTVELAPTSNVRIGAVANLRDHPLPAMLDAGVPIVLGNDDPAFFDTTMSDEWRSLLKMGLSETDVAQQFALAQRRITT